MNESTRKLLEECSLGCQMAAAAFEQVSGFIRDSELQNLVDDYTEKHRCLEEEAAALLESSGNPEKSPGIMASTLSWFTTEIKLTADSSNTQIAKLLIDGCSMGIKTLGEKANRFDDAEKSASGLAQRIIRTEEDLMKKLEEFL